MPALLFLLPITMGLAGLFVWLFLRAARDGQFEDLDDPPERMLHDED